LNDPCCFKSGTEKLTCLPSSLRADHNQYLVILLWRVLLASSDPLRKAATSSHEWDPPTLSKKGFWLLQSAMATAILARAYIYMIWQTHVKLTTSMWDLVLDYPHLPFPFKASFMAAGSSAYTVSNGIQQTWYTKTGWPLHGPELLASYVMCKVHKSWGGYLLAVESFICKGSGISQTRKCPTTSESWPANEQCRSEADNIL
jgi:hypothetical protein